MADIINEQEFRAIVIDYDYNAPNIEHLAKTHEPFFKRVRQGHPDTPIILISRPNFIDCIFESPARRDIIKTTYVNAWHSGDRNVYFFDGAILFDGPARECCTIDSVHPTDLGHFRMAAKLNTMLDKIII